MAKILVNNTGLTVIDRDEVVATVGKGGMADVSFSALKRGFERIVNGADQVILVSANHEVAGHDVEVMEQITMPPEGKERLHDIEPGCVITVNFHQSKVVESNPAPKLPEEFEDLEDHEQFEKALELGLIDEDDDPFAEAEDVAANECCKINVIA